MRRSPHVRQACLSKLLLDANLSPETRERLSTVHRSTWPTSLVPSAPASQSKNSSRARHYPATAWHRNGTRFRGSHEPGRTMTPANTPHGRLPACYVPLTGLLFDAR